MKVETSCSTPFTIYAYTKPLVARNLNAIPKKKPWYFIRGMLKRNVVVFVNYILIFIRKKWIY